MRRCCSIRNQQHHNLAFGFLVKLVEFVLPNLTKAKQTLSKCHQMFPCCQLPICPLTFDPGLQIRVWIRCCLLQHLRSPSCVWSSLRHYVTTGCIFDIQLPGWLTATCLTQNLHAHTHTSTVYACPRWVWDQQDLTNSDNNWVTC